MSSSTLRKALEELRSLIEDATSIEKSRNQEEFTSWHLRARSALERLLPASNHAREFNDIEWRRRGTLITRQLSMEEDLRRANEAAQRAGFASARGVLQAAIADLERHGLPGAKPAETPKSFPAVKAAVPKDVLSELDGGGIVGSSGNPAQSGGLNLNEHPVLVVLGMIVAAFLGGWGAFEYLEGKVHSMVTEDVKQALAEQDRGKPVAPPASLPAGTIIAWYVKNGPLPAGWAICDGNNGTPNLMDRYLVGAANQEETGRTIGKGYGLVRIADHVHQFNVGNQGARTIRSQGNVIYVDPNTQLPNAVNAFTEASGAQELPLSEPPASTKVLFLMKLS